VSLGSFLFEISLLGLVMIFFLVICFLRFFFEFKFNYIFGFLGFLVGLGLIFYAFNGYQEFSFEKNWKDAEVKVLGEVVNIEGKLEFVACRPSKCAKFVYSGVEKIFSGDVLRIREYKVREIKKKWKLNFYRKNLQGDVQLFEFDKLASIKDFWFYFWEVKNNLVFVLSRNLNVDESAILSGILFGYRSSLDEKLSEEFRIVGITHILAISGFNITLIINVFGYLLVKSGKIGKLAFISVAIILFAIFTGYSASVVRASFMGIISVLGDFLNRPVPILNSLLMSVFVIVLTDPLAFNFDLSLQLSMFATLSLILFSNKIEINIMSFGEILSGTITAQILTLPVIIYYFGSISLISPIANVLVLPFLPIIMILGFLALLFGNLSISGFIYYFAEVFLKLIIGISKWLSKIPYANLDVSESSEIVTFLYLIFLFMVSHKHRLVRNYFQSLSLLSEPVLSKEFEKHKKPP